MSIIEVRDVVKSYRLGQLHNLRESLKRFVHAKGAQPRNTFNALDGVNFSVDQGEVLGIIGTNGAGKSTLLKVLAGITTPTTGTMVARGRVAPLIEVGAGLIAELTGRENIYLNGVILGMSVKEVRRKLDDIVAFAELEQFIDTPIKRYSSGMAVRLGFAIATAVDCEILIVDEVLAVGDIAFQRKCFDRIETIIKEQHKTILLVSHNIRQVERLCTRTVLLDHGRIVLDGETREVCRHFFERTNIRVREAAEASSKRDTASQGRAANPWPAVDLTSIELLDASGKATQLIPFRSDVVVEIRIRTSITLNNPVFGVGVHTSDMLYLATHHSDLQLPIDVLEAGDHTIRCVLRRLALTPGVYSMRFSLSDGVGATTAYYAENLIHFQVTMSGTDVPPPPNAEGFFALEAEWQSPRTMDMPSLVRAAA